MTTRKSRWAKAGCVPDTIAAQLSDDEQAVLAFIAFACRQGGSAELSIKQIGRQTGAPYRTARTLLKRASGDEFRLIEVDVRSARGMVNRVSICDQTWLAWLSAGRWYGQADFRHGRSAEVVTVAAEVTPDAVVDRKVEKAARVRRSWVLLGGRQARG
jgi:hypothetical protein